MRTSRWRLGPRFLAYIARTADKWTASYGYDDAMMARARAGAERWLSADPPLLVALDPEAGFSETMKAFREARDALRRRGTFPLDLWARYPDLARVPRIMPVGLVFDRTPEECAFEAGRLLTLVTQGRQCWLSFDSSRLPASAVRRIQAQLFELIQDASDDTRAVGKLRLMSGAERERVLFDWNRTEAEWRHEALIHELFQARAAEHPDAPALAFKGNAKSYGELEARANQLAWELRDRGVGPDDLVGVCLDRSVEMVVAVLAVLKAGGAYVPVDPGYPPHRIEHMIADSRAKVVVSDSRHQSRLSGSGATVLDLDRDATAISRHPTTAPASGAHSANLAYVIYTSGSTGRPKGVMVEHRNVVNFFAGMDRVIDGERPGAWLAVTSLSFDISVLELLWTLARGFKVVLHAEHAGAQRPIPKPHARRPIEFSLFFWGNDDAPGEGKYDLLLKAAEFADESGFAAVWTPERHFHAFGGPYPNPSVTGAAVAARTRSIQVRAGSCVLPLHHPVRVAEEWAVVDNISGGRAAISFASGWQPNDFLLRPENFKDAKAVMARDIDVVRRLWRGEAVRFPGPLGKDVEVVTQPRPVQKELPFWVTTAGNPESYRAAGEMGANVLTHLLGQTLDELRDKIRIYREAREQAGHDPATGKVSLMLHTFVGQSDAEVRDIVRGPMKAYLASSTSLLKDAAWTFPAFKRPKGAASASDLNLGELSATDLDAILEHAFLRYYESSGLFGSFERCLERIDTLRSVGVDDVACMIDFGVPTARVLESLHTLAELRDRAHRQEQGLEPDDAFAALVARHGVTHLQCTPSMARLLLADESTRGALSAVRHWMLGGEAFPPALAREIAAVTEARITNMYGPTETTVWSSTEDVQSGAAITIGRPIANTRLYVVDARGNLQPPGVPGELWIGGAGVVRGYHERPELTAERFVEDPFRSEAGARVYKTGDLVRFLDDGRVEFLGRIDHQVKVRGYRIELGEIEALITEQPGVEQAVVVAREDEPGDQRLVAYLTGPAAPSATALRSVLETRLPAFMVPSAFVEMDALPLTPNGKVDRKALPAPPKERRDAERELEAPETEFEREVAAIWQDELQLDRVGKNDDFFALGGHSLLAAQVIARLRERFLVSLSLATLFQLPAPTVAHLALAVEAVLLEQIESMSDEQAAALLSRET